MCSLCSHKTTFITVDSKVNIKMLTDNADFKRSACVRNQLEAVCQRDGTIASHVVVNRAAHVFQRRDHRDALRPL